MRVCLTIELLGEVPAVISTPPSNGLCADNPSGLAVIFVSTKNLAVVLLKSGAVVKVNSLSSITDATVKVSNVAGSCDVFSIIISSPTFKNLLNAVNDPSTLVLPSTRIRVPLVATLAEILSEVKVNEPEDVLPIPMATPDIASS